MGLGKTLTALAMISASLGRAQDFASCASKRKTNGEEIITRAKATLVVVPSERKFCFTVSQHKHARKVAARCGKRKGDWTHSYSY